MDGNGTSATGRGDFDIVAIAASWGGPSAIATVLAGLPADFPAAVAVVQHRSAGYPSFLVDLLGRRTALAVAEAEDGAALRAGMVHVAPPDRHLLVRPGGTMALSRAGRHQFARPSADLLFASAAECHRERAIAVVLTGKQQDGAAGAWAVKAMGGRVLAQDPATCEAPDMPAAAIRSGCVDFVLPLDRIAAVLVALTMAPGTAPLFRVPPEASLARARQLWLA